MLTYRLHISLLGRFQVVLDGKPITNFAADSARALLAYLAIESSHPQARDNLAELFWSEQPRDKGLANLRTALTRLRSALGDGDGDDALILVTRQTIGLNPACTLWVDINEFEQLAHAVRAHRHRHQDRCPHCAEAMQRMIDLYANDFLADVHIQSANFDVWQRGYREQLYETYQEILQSQTAFHLHRADFAAAAHNAHRQLQEQAWHEGAHYQLMQALVGSGRRDAALAQYKRYSRVLEEELGGEPAAEIRQLYQQLSRGQMAPVSAPAGLHTVPEQALLRGRQRELHWLTEQLVDPAVRLITLVGIGGMGKTRLAVAAAHALQGCFADGVWFISLLGMEAVATVPAGEEAIAAKVAGVLDLPPISAGSQRAQLLTGLQHKELLLVLDNFEQLLAARTLLLDLLGAAPRLTLLVTSRRQIGVSHEIVYPLQGLDSPAEDAALADAPTVSGEIDAQKYAAAALFIDAARRLNPNFAIAADQFPHLLHICRLVGGLPLALELAASSTTHLPLAAIAQRIEQNFALLIADSEAFPLRQRSVYAAISEAWQLFTPTAQHNFAQLSVFSGGFTLEVAQAVVGVSGSQLAELVRHLFLQFDSNQGRYQIHELLRQYGAEKLAADHELSVAVRQRHAAYFCGWIGAIQFQLKTHKAQEILKLIALELDNVKQAWYYAALEKNVEWLDQAMEGLNAFYLQRHRYQEGAELCQATLRLLQDADSFDALVARAMLLVWQGRYSQILEDIEGANAQNTQAQVLLDAAAQIQGERDADAVRAAVLMQRGHLTYRNVKAAIGYFEAALVLIRKVGDRWNESNLLAALASAAGATGELEKAERLNTAALALRAEAGAPTAIAQSWLDLGIVALNQQRFAKAKQLLASAHQLYAEVDEPYGVARTTGYLGIIEARTGGYTAAFSLLNDAINRLDQLHVFGERALFLAEMTKLPISQVVAPLGR